MKDGVMIRAAIEGAKDGITSLLARLIRDVMMVEFPELFASKSVLAAGSKITN